MLLRPHAFVSWIFLRGLGLVYSIAFCSLAVQVLGLIGQHGILPAQDYQELIHKSLGSDAYLRLPTLFWFNCSDATLQISAWTGCLLGVLLFLNIAPLICLSLLWALYLSFVNIGQQFFGFQWDSLLLETGILALFISPTALLPRFSMQASPSPYAILLLRWLTFRLMFASGAVKLLSNDPTWWSLSALQYHYETQPLPNLVAYYAHQLPPWFQTTSVGLLFFIELILPMFIFSRLRWFSAFGFIFLQVLIMLTGNYTFFNLLAILLALILLDDFELAPLLPNRLQKAISFESYVPSWTPLRVCQHLLIALAFLVATDQLFLQLRQPTLQPPQLLTQIRELANRTRSFNTYGLFAVMTTTRPEIIIEGSEDGTEWKPYAFRWKPGDLYSAPSQVAPHQPRLDWQMWFAALGTPRGNYWFLALVQRLLEGTAEVIELFKYNPFPGSPPRFIRAKLYDYEFTNSEEHAADGAWWKRKELRTYLPAVTLKER